MGGEIGFAPFVIGLAGVGVAGFVSWVIRSIFIIKNDVAALRLHVAENYATNPDIQKLESQLEKVSTKIDSMLEVMYSIKAKVEAEGGK